MKLIITIISLQWASTILALPGELHLANEWELFKLKHNKQYDNNDELQRINIFRKNLEYIEDHNELYKRGLASYEMGVNQFADMTTNEFASYINKYNNSDDFDELAKNFTLLVTPQDPHPLPYRVDWRSRGYVGPVKNQGECGSCWSFAVTGTVEGQYFKKTGHLVSFSEQNLIDCTLNKGNNGCAGGSRAMGFQYVISDGIELQEDYPYIGKNGYCQFDPAKSVVQAKDLMIVKRDDEDDLQFAVANAGPVSSSVYVLDSLRFYKSGYYYDPACRNDRTTHAVLIVGYGVENYNEYWLIKNSWGAEWGEAGYFKLARNRYNHCGIVTRANYVTL